jgi:hypothetical protein
MVQTTTATRWLTALVLIGVLIASVRAADDPAALGRAVKSVERARRLLQPRRAPAEILSLLDAAAKSLDAVAAPDRPDLIAVDPEADAAGSAKTGEENRRRLKAWRRACDAHRKSVDRLRARWVRVLGEALTIRRIEGGSLDNVHAEVNRRALALLIETGHTAAANLITAALEDEWLYLSRLTLRESIAIHVLAELHKLRSPEAFDWLRRTFVGKERPLLPSVPTNHLARGRESARPPPDMPVYAMQAIARHEGMPGAARHAMVRDLLAAYAPLERRAAHGFEVERWERMRIAVIHATLCQAGDPTDEAGEPLTSMAGLLRWFRGHRSPRQAPWAD